MRLGLLCPDRHHNVERLYPLTLTNRHALQLRQAKLAFPSVHLLVGVPNDELCKTYKARTVLSYFERLESVRQCRWTDEVVPEAPWVITPEFIKKYEIDYVAHDEEPYAHNGSGDIYGPIKELGERTFFISFSHVWII